MTFRKIISLSIALSFIVLLTTGILSYFQSYSRLTATLHTVFAVLFSLGVLLHLKNNFTPITKYVKGKLVFAIFAILALFFTGAYFQTEPFISFMDYGAKLKANSNGTLNSSYEIVEMDMGRDLQVTIDLQRSTHYWHPQMAVWVEDSIGNYIETLFVSKATAQGLFFGGRSKENFQEFDQNKTETGDYRRVDALPVWSHKRGVQYADGMYVPPNTKPLPDGITGATLMESFMLTSTIDSISNFHVRVELNVAFDDNEFYSEFDFPDDDTFHNGTGQLGQPSIVFDAAIDLNDGEDFYLLDFIGHGHHSAKTGEIYNEVETLTTAMEIVERIVVGVKNSM